MLQTALRLREEPYAIDTVNLDRAGRRIVRRIPHIGVPVQTIAGRARIQFPQNGQRVRVSLVQAHVRYDAA